MQSLDGTLSELFGDKDIFGDNNSNGDSKNYNEGGRNLHRSVPASQTPLYTANSSGGGGGGSIGNADRRQAGGVRDDAGWVEIRGDTLNATSSPSLTDARYRHHLHSSAQGGWVGCSVC